MVKIQIDLGNKVNVMWPGFAEQLGLFVQKIDVGAQKIDGR